MSKLPRRHELLCWILHKAKVPAFAAMPWWAWAIHCVLFPLDGLFYYCRPRGYYDPRRLVFRFDGIEVQLRDLYLLTEGPDKMLVRVHKRDARSIRLEYCPQDYSREIFEAIRKQRRPE